jgi:hypothetical protein
LLSPAVKIEYAEDTIAPLLMDEKRNLQIHNNQQLVIEQPLYLYFKFDNQSFPVVLNKEEDICLGKVDRIETLIKS